MTFGAAFGSGWFGQTYSETVESATEVVDTGCDILQADGSLILLADGSGALLRATCVDGAATGGVPHRIPYIQPTPLYDEEEELIATVLAVAARRRNRRRRLTVV